MMAFIRRMLGERSTPITYRDVAPAPRDEDMERQIKTAQDHLVQDILRVERRSCEIRQELASGVINIRAGGDRP